MKRISIILLTFLCTLSSFAARRGFAIVIDQQSLNEARHEIEHYAKAIEDVNGLKTYIVVDKWNVPDSIRACLEKMYNDKDCRLAGAVFVGDIPVPMIRDAQYLTSAFRIDQGRPRKESSCPSDRFYDDFGLKFDYLDKDTDGDPYFYYSLRADGEQRIRQSIFSGRIRPTDAGGTSRYEKLRNYLQKAVRAKSEQNIVDKLFYFTGHGSLTESKVAAIDEKGNLYEHFPWLLTMRDGISYMDFAQEKYIKQSMMNELMRPELDFAVLHHHGDYDTQYLSGPAPKDASEEEKLMPDIHLEDFAAYGFKPNCRFVSFDACYNASFHRDDCIANEYIFSSGQTVAIVGGTVNVLQDKWYDKLAGLLGLGVYVGYLAAYQQYLETHIVGDPTFTFTPAISTIDLNELIAAAWRGEADTKVIKELLQQPHADLQCLALELLDEQGELDNATLLELLDKSPLSLVRLQALHLLARHGGEDFVKALQLSAFDRNEMVQRFTMNFIRQNGDPRLATPLTTILLQNNPSARVKFDAEEAMKLMPKELMHAEIDRQGKNVVSTNADSLITRLKNRTADMSNFWNERINLIVSDSISDKEFQFIGSSLRLYMLQERVPEIIEYILRPSTSDVRKIKLTNALGWNRNSYQREAIARFAEQLSHDTMVSDSVRNEALKTYNRVK